MERALELKRDRLASRALEGKSVALVFERPSTRTRLSFDVGVHELGGHPLILRPDELQVARGESLRDLALVLSRMVHAVGVRTGPHEPVEELAGHASIPVVNMLTRDHHPCQALADLLTLRERFGRLEGLKLAYVGDGNNVARSLLRWEDWPAWRWPWPRRPSSRSTVWPRSRPRRPCADAHAVYTDVWISMGDDEDAEEKRALLRPYRLDEALFAQARDDAVVLHCLPAHPGEEITEGCSTGSARRYGIRPRTACTPRRRCSSCCVLRRLPAAGSRVQDAAARAAAAGAAAPRAAATPPSRCRTSRPPPEPGCPTRAREPLPPEPELPAPAVRRCSESPELGVPRPRVAGVRVTGAGVPEPELPEPELPDPEFPDPESPDPPPPDPELPVDPPPPGSESVEVSGSQPEPPIVGTPDRAPPGLVESVEDGVTGARGVPDGSLEDAESRWAPARARRAASGSAALRTTRPAEPDPLTSSRDASGSGRRRSSSRAEDRSGGWRGDRTGDPHGGHGGPAAPWAIGPAPPVRKTMSRSGTASTSEDHAAPAPGRSSS